MSLTVGTKSSSFPYMEVNMRCASLLAKYGQNVILGHLNSLSTRIEKSLDRHTKRYDIVCLRGNIMFGTRKSFRYTQYFLSLILLLLLLLFTW